MRDSGFSDSQSMAVYGDKRLTREERLLLRDRPYAFENASSQRRRQAPPVDLFGWFLAGYRAEMPMKVHRTNGVWHDQVTRQEAEDGVAAVGGSQMGTLPNDELFRRLIEDGPFACEFAEYEGHKDARPHYLFPMRAALQRMASSKPFLSRMLKRIAFLDGDVEFGLRSYGITEPEVVEATMKAALHMLWSKYDTEPPARILPKKDKAA
jgi:hypothetical protein